MQPIGMPSRSLKLAMALRALVTTGFWPVIAVSSATATSSTLAFWIASPQAHVDDDLVEPRHLIAVRVAHAPS